MKTKVLEKDNFIQLHQSIRTILIESRNKSYAAINSAMIYAYWSVGKQIMRMNKKVILEENMGKIFLSIYLQDSQKNLERDLQ